METQTSRSLITMKSLRTALAVLFAIFIGYASPANATPEEVQQRAQTDLNGKCLELFLSNESPGLLKRSSFFGYQVFADSLLGNAVFVFGGTNSQQYCTFATKGAFLTWEDAEKSAIAACEKKRFQGGTPCVVYARNNNIVYVSVHERLKTAKSLYEAGDPTANLAIIKVSKKDLSALTSRERGEYEYLAGKSVSKTVWGNSTAIEHFNYAWSLYNNVNGAVEEGNLRMAGDIDINWRPIRNAYQYFLANASVEQKAQHPEVEQNMKQTEPYYQADLAQREVAAKELAKHDAIAAELKAKQQAVLAKEQQKQAQIDALQAKREAEQRAKQAQLDAIKTAREEKQREDARQAEAKRIAIEGDGSADDATCKSYGARPGSEGYVTCRVQLGRTKQLADEQQAAQKASEVTAEKARNLANFHGAKKCADETKNPTCINNAGTYALRLGNMGDARDWWTLAARYGDPVAIKNLTNNGFPIPEPDLLRGQEQARNNLVRQQEQAKNSDNAAAALLLLLGGVNAYQQGKAAGHRSTPTPEPARVDCTTDVVGSTAYTRCR